MMMVPVLIALLVVPLVVPSFALRALPAALEARLLPIVCSAVPDALVPSGLMPPGAVVLPSELLLPPL
jgi:hypothetical protein